MKPVEAELALAYLARIRGDLGRLFELYSDNPDDTLHLHDARLPLLKLEKKTRHKAGRS